MTVTVVAETTRGSTSLNCMLAVRNFRVSLHADFLDPDFWTRRLSLVGTFEKFLEWSLQADSTKVQKIDLITWPDCRPSPPEIGTMAAALRRGPTILGLLQYRSNRLCSKLKDTNN